MLKRLLFLITMVLLLTSCLTTEEDEDEEPDQEATYYLQRRLSTLTTEYGFKHIQDFKYKYNEQQLLTGITTSDTSAVNIVLAYDTDNRLITEKNNRMRWDNEYNNEHQLVKQRKSFTSIDGRTDYYFYLHSYNSEGLLEESKYYFEESVTNRLMHTQKYTYAGGELVKIDRIQADSEELMEINITYDDKKVPLPVLPLLTVPAYGAFELPVQLSLNHNIKSFTVQGRGGVLYTASSCTATYTYNKAGYPKKAIKTYADGAKEFVVYSY